MTLCDYAINKGMDLQGYKTLESNVDVIASAIVENIKSLHKIDTGVYYPVNEIINPIGRTDLVPYIIQSLKSKGVEFIEDYTLYRF